MGEARSRHQESGEALATAELTEGLRAARIELMSLLDQFELFTKQVETVMNQVMEILNEIPRATPMLNIPGVGVRLQGSLRRSAI
ncbi:hypothetical protein BK127_39830 [Paenibacillus sp. FSL H7-0331]|nr:hypothetical protein BK127_39830 [Paenibacillus sp. FSL H7-0331]